MPQRLTSTDPDFESTFSAFLETKREVSDDVDAIAADIISDVRRRGDAALCSYTAKFDRLEISPSELAVSKSEREAAIGRCEPDTVDALRFAHARIVAHHERQKPADDAYTDALGVKLASRWTAVEAAGLYVPGGLASYPSSVLMNAVPARVAGVPRIVMVVPSPAGELNPLVLAAADIAGVDEVYRVGGAQAVAALAYGTETIAPVAKIVGPGNAFVAAAKRRVFGTVGIDSVAGPSEVLVIADADNDPAWIAADLLAQAEHDTAAQSILMTDNAAFADAVEREVLAQLTDLPRGNIAGESWQQFGGVIVLETLDEAPRLADRIAAEHLEIATADAHALSARIRNAGAIFIGRHTPEVIGDYVSGSNHVLPTARSARFSSGLGVLDFMKRTSLLELDEAALQALSGPAMTLARAEGLEAHRRSVEIRANTIAMRDRQTG